MVDGKTLTWQRFINEQPMVDLEQLYGMPQNRAVYAYAEVMLDRDIDLYLKIGSDDDFTCWFNGEVAGRFDGGRAWLADQDVLKVSGKKGVNKILIKVVNRGGQWALSARLTDRQDNPIHFRSE